jgi:predicted nucleotidyltransferase
MGAPLSNNLSINKFLDIYSLLSNILLKTEKMLDLLTKSTIRKKIIILFIYNQDKDYYLSEIAKFIKTSPGTAQRELNRLLKINLITMRKRGGLNVYQLNKEFALLKEVESIVKKTIGIEAELEGLLKGIKDIEFAFIFGSYAKGGLKSDSDIDLFIVISKPNEDQVYRALKKIEDKIKREINYHISRKEEFIENLENRYFYKDIVDNFILIKGSRDEFRKFIEKPGQRRKTKKTKNRH